MLLLAHTYYIVYGPPHKNHSVRIRNFPQVLQTLLQDYYGSGWRKPAEENFYRNTVDGEPYDDETAKRMIQSREPWDDNYVRL